MTDPPIHEAATQYTVCALPPESLYYRYYAITVTRFAANPELWKINHGEQVFTTSCDWGYLTPDRLPFSDLNDALATARRLAPDIEVNGVTARDLHHQHHGTQP